MFRGYIAYIFHRELEMIDMKLIFHDGRSTKVDSFKLKMSSMDGILHNLIEDIIEPEMKEIRDDLDLPIIQVLTMQSCTHMCKQCDASSRTR